MGWMKIFGDLNGVAIVGFLIFHQTVEVLEF